MDLTPSSKREKRTEKIPFEAGMFRGICALAVLASVLVQQASCFQIMSASLPLRSLGIGRMQRRVMALSLRTRNGALLAVAQEKTEQDEQMEMVKTQLTDMFKKYDKNHDGYLTMEEYNQWCVDTKRGIRQITTEYRYKAFCKVRLSTEHSVPSCFPGMPGFTLREQALFSFRSLSPLVASSLDPPTANQVGPEIGDLTSRSLVLVQQAGAAGQCEPPSPGQRTGARLGSDRLCTRPLSFS
jgi:hypothetical protein